MQVPADVVVSESPFVTEHPAVPELLTEKEIAPSPLPPLIESLRSVRNVPLVEINVNVFCAALDTVIVTLLVDDAAK